MRLALVGAIRDEILDKQELAVWLINYLEKEYPGALQNRYLNAEPAADSSADPSAEEEEAMLPPGYALLLRIARARGLLVKGGEPDADRAASMLIDDCKNGRIGRISLDRLQDAEQMEKERLAFAQAQEQEKEKEKEAARRKAAGSAGNSRAAARGRSIAKSGESRDSSRGRGSGTAGRGKNDRRKNSSTKGRRKT
jgi:ribosome biogenesis GTPase A